MCHQGGYILPDKKQFRFYEVAGKKKTYPFVRLVALSLGAGAFCALRFGYHRGIMLSLFAGFAGYILAGMLLRSFLKKKEDDIPVPPDAGITAEEAKAIITGSEAKIRDIRAMTMRVKSNKVAGEIRDICRAGMDITAALRKDPRNIRRARQFIDYYLESTHKIVLKYVELSEAHHITPEIEKSLTKVEEVLGTIKTTFERQLAKLLEHELLDLDVEVQVLEKTMKMEG